MPKLTITESGQSSVFELFEDEVTVGRGASNALQVSDGHASKNHAVVRRIQGRAKVVDLESKNGTKVNGEFRNQRWLEDGDTISIGDATIVFEAGEPVAVGRAGGSRPAAVVSGAAAVAEAAAPGRPLPQLKSAHDRDRLRERRRPHDDRDDDDDEERGPRVPARRDSNSAMIAAGVGFGLLGLFALMFFMLSKSGAGSNASALAESKRMWAHSKTIADREAAIRFLEQNSNPNDADTYRSVKEDLDSMKEQMGTFEGAALGEEAFKIYKKIDFDRIELHKGINTKESLSARLQQFTQQYMGTPEVQDYLHNPYPPHNKMRELSGEGPASDAMAKIFKEWEKIKNEKLSDSERLSRESDIRTALVALKQQFPRSLILDEIDRSKRAPFPDFRRILGQ